VRWKIHPSYMEIICMLIMCGNKDLTYRWIDACSEGNKIKQIILNNRVQALLYLLRPRFNL
jgi:hypothetical protein